MRVFLTVVEHGSLTQGAQALHLSLASVSERVSGMESALGARLLERKPRGVSATPAGQALTRNARVVLAQVEQMRGELRTYATGLKGRIKLLSNTAALAAFLPRQLCGFLAAYPDLSVELLERPSAEIVLAIAEGRADLGLVANIADFSALQTHPIAEDQLVVVASKTHRIATKQQGVAFTDIVGEPFIGVSDAALETHLGERASRLGRQIHYRVQLRSVADVGMLVAANTGIAVLSEASTGTVSCQNVVILPLLEPWASRKLHLCARDFSSLTPHAQLLAQKLMGSNASSLSGVNGKFG